MGILLSLGSCAGAAGPLVAAVLPLLQPEATFSLTALLPIGFALLFAIPFLFVGVLLIVLGARPLLARAKVSPPEVSISNTSPAVGEVLTFTYRQSFKGAADAKRIRFHLILRESATYRRGTDTVTVRHEHLVQEHELPARHFQAGEAFQDQRQFQVPVQGMHTFSASNNKLDWFLQARVEMSGWPDFVEEYPLAVQPRLAAGAGGA